MYAIRSYYAVVADGQVLLAKGYGVKRVSVGHPDTLDVVVLGFV